VPHRLQLGPLDVTTKAIRPVSLSGLLNTPEKRGENLHIDGMNGSVRVGGKKYNGRSMPLDFQVWGRNPDGTPAADPAGAMLSHLSLLGQVLGQDVITMTHTFPDGTVREIPVEVIASTEPELHHTGDYLTMSVVFESPWAFWRSPAAVAPAFNLTNGGSRVMVEFAPSQAPIDDAVYTIGPSSNPRLGDTVSGLFVQYLDVIGAGRTLVIDAGAKKLTGTGGLVPDRTKLRTHASDGRWMALCPAVGTAPTLTLTQTGGSGAVPLTVSGRQSWIFG
jgi:hypothetical protein